MQRLNLWINPRIVALTDRTDFDVASLAGELFTFYLAVPAQKKILKPAAALVFNYLLDMALEAPLSSFKFPLALFLDEFTNFGMIPAIADKMGIIRHRQMPAMLGFQDYVQLRAVYGEDDATFLFGQPGTRFFFRTRELATSERVSKLLGQETVVERKLTTNCSVQEREFGKPLLSPGELMAIPPEESVVFTPSTPPVKLKRFTWRDYVNQMSVPAPEREQIEIDERLIKDCKEQEVSPTWEQEWEAKHKGKPAPSPHSETPKDTKQATETKEEPKKETVTAEDETNQIKQEAVINTETEPDEEDDLPI